MTRRFSGFHHHFPHHHHYPPIIIIIMRFYMLSLNPSNKMPGHFIVLHILQMSNLNVRALGHVLKNSQQVNDRPGNGIWRFLVLNLSSFPRHQGLDKAWC